MVRTRGPRLVALLGAGLLLVGSVGAASAANPNAAYSFTACWDDGTVTGVTGIRGTQTWSAIRVTAVSFGFANLQFGEYYTISGARTGSETSGWHSPEAEGGDFVGTLLNGRRVVATDSIPEPAGGWSTLSACPVD